LQQLVRFPLGPGLLLNNSGKGAWLNKNNGDGGSGSERSM